MISNRNYVPVGFPKQQKGEMKAALAYKEESEEWEVPYVIGFGET